MFAINLKSLVNIETCFGRSLDISASFHHFVDDLNRKIIANLTIGVVIGFVSHQNYRNIFFSGLHFDYLPIYWNQFLETLLWCYTAVVFAIRVKTIIWEMSTKKSNLDKQIDCIFVCALAVTLINLIVNTYKPGRMRVLYLYWVFALRETDANQWCLWFVKCTHFYCKISLVCMCPL